MSIEDQLRQLLNCLPHDTLYIVGEPYMRRWYLAGWAPPVAGPGGVGVIPRPGMWWSWANRWVGGIRLHEIVASDDSRAYHDHPWDFLSIGLRGSYVEETTAVVPGETLADVYAPAPGWGDRHRFRAPFINRHRATDLHVLHVGGNRPCWTLFITGPKIRSWGFAGPFGWLGWRDFDAQYPERDAWTEGRA